MQDKEASSDNVSTVQTVHSVYTRLPRDSSCRRPNWDSYSTPRCILGCLSFSRTLSLAQLARRIAKDQGVACRFGQSEVFVCFYRFPLSVRSESVQNTIKCSLLLKFRRTSVLLWKSIPVVIIYATLLYINKISEETPPHISNDHKGKLRKPNLSCRFGGRRPQLGDATDV